MPIINEVVVEVWNLVDRSIQNNNAFVARQVGSGTPTSSDPTTSTATNPPSTTSTTTGTGNGTTNSPLLFFVALGFGVVFTNLWIIVGVKYCFRYNARNRALRAGEEGEITLENMPTRPHRRRREKKLMTMDEVNERFPLAKYKTWITARAREGLPTSGGVAAPSSRPASVKNMDMTEEASSPVDSRPSADMPNPPALDKDASTSPIHDHAAEQKSVLVGNEKKEEERSLEPLKEVTTTTSTVDKGDDDDEDDHIHTAVPPELLTNPGDSCAICIDTLEDDDDIRGLTCGHAFHAGCLDPWLTSRRACCPLCKADYYTPKPRPERTPEELAAEAAHRRSGRMNMPQSPNSAWTGIRGSPRLMLPGGNERVGRRSRRDRNPAHATNLDPVGPQNTGPGTPSSAPASSRWRARNPFSGVSMPTVRMPGRNHQTTDTPPADPTPSQLEAGAR